MASFELFKPLIVPLEGDEYTEIPGDYGGGTKYGITKRTYPNVDIKNLDLDSAAEIWKRDYWGYYNLYAVGNQDVANKIMSYVMNMNSYSAIRCVQRAINHCGGNVVEDGIFGVKSINAINGLPVGWLIDRLKLEGVAFYNFRVSVDKTQIQFLEGWINRALK